MMARYVQLTKFSVYFWAVLIGSFIYMWHRSGYGLVGLESGFLTASALGVIMILTVAFWRDAYGKSNSEN